MQSDATAATVAARRLPVLKLAGLVAAFIAALVVIFGIVSRLLDARDAQSWSDARAIPTVHLVTVKRSATAEGLILPGTMQAWNAAKMYARVNGYIKSWDRDIGDPVKAGDILGRIDTPELDQQIGQARADMMIATANAGLARSTAKRWNNLLTTDSVSKQEADEKNGDLAAKSAAVDAARANLGQLTAMKEFAILRAPFAGTVTMRNADIGDLVGPGTSGQQPLFAVADVHKVRIYVSVPQTYSAALKQGLPASLSLPDFPGRTFPAAIVGISGAIGAQSGTFQVELIADNPNGALKSGGYAQVSFDVAGRSGTNVIPTSALIFRAQGSFVATVSPDGRVRKIPVKLGRDFGSTIEVTSGLAADTRIIDNPLDSLTDGQLVRIGG